MIHQHILDKPGNTPLVRLELEESKNVNLYSKLEYLNPTGSIKDRAAHYVLQKLLVGKEIDKETTIIESSSGNFGIALSAYCKRYGLKFICVVDPHINAPNERLISLNGGQVVKVDQPDRYGGYLLNRIKKVNTLLHEIPNTYWINQYGNPYNAEAYYQTLGGEICAAFERLDYIFLGISSGGTITGVSNRVKEKYPHIKVIAVDIEGSVIFGRPAKKRYIPGIGSSMVPKILKQAKIDDVVILDEKYTVEMCYELLNRHQVFAGGSSGSVYGAVKKYFKDHQQSHTVQVLTAFPDRGERYIETIYNQEWCKRL